MDEPQEQAAGEIPFGWTQRRVRGLGGAGHSLPDPAAGQVTSDGKRSPRLSSK